MKKLLLLSCLCMFLTSAQAQVELKINPLGILFSSPDLAAEYLVNDNLGVELSLGLVYGNTLGSGLIDDSFKIKKSGYRVRLSGKYYFSPEDGCDKFYAGMYLGPRSTKFSGDSTVWGYDPGYKLSGFAIGLLVGYKWVADSGLVFEIGAGGGRALGEKFTFNDGSLDESGFDGFGVDFVGTLAVGYRFGDTGGGSKKKKRRRR